MPPFSNTLSRRWSPSELPILPFLAPRVFQPWPSKCTRVHLKTKANQNQGDDGHSRSKATGRADGYSKCSGNSPPPHVLLQPGTKYTKVKKRQSTPTSFAHADFPTQGSFRHFSSNSAFGGIDQNNVRVGSAIEGPSKASHEFVSHVRMETQPDTISTPQALGMKGPVEISSSTVPRFVRSNPLSDDSRVVHRVSSNDAPGKRHVRSEWISHRIPLNAKDVYPSRDSETSRPEDFIDLSPNDRPRPTAQQSSFSKSSSTPQIASSKGLTTSPSSPSTSTPPEKSSNASDSSHQTIPQALHRQYELWAKQQGLPELATKYLKIHPNAKANIMELQMWSSRFAIIHQRHEDALKGYPKMEYKKVAVSNFPAATRLLFIKQDNVAALTSIWRRVPVEIRSHIWEELMLTSMDQYPASTLKLLLATYQVLPLPPQWAANDCLDFIVSHYFGSEESRPTPESFAAVDLRQIFASIRYLQLCGLRLSSRSVYLLQSMMNEREFRTFYHALVRSGQHLNGKILLRFTYRFARSQETDLAFHVLQQATRQGIHLNLERWPQICNVLLARRYRSPDSQVTDTELFDFMLHHGLKPGLCTYNILIQNSLEAGDHVTAWQIYDMMIENGFMADVYTYSIMLNDAKVRGDDAAVDRLVHWMHVDGVGNSYTATDILDSVFLIQRREFFRRPPSERKYLPTAFSQMLPIYMKNFNVEPLAKLIPQFEETFLSPAPTNSAGEVDDISVSDAYQGAEQDQHLSDLPVVADPQSTPSNHESEGILIEPNHVTLIVMLKSYIGSVRNYKALLEFYNHFKSLITTRNPVVAPLLKQAQIYNHLLVGLGHLNAPMHDCLQIIADMQTPYSKTSHSTPDSEMDQSHDESDVVPVPHTLDESDPSLESDDISVNSTDTNFLPPPPSLHTWTTLLNLFMQRRQPRAAEKVLQIMIEKEGLEPNQATWNALTMGYMRLQDPLMTADALIRTKRSGFIVDHIMSSRWWLRFQARARLSEALKSASGGNETSLADVVNTMESESEMADPFEDEIVDEEVLETATLKTGDIYRILKYRLHAVNSPVYPNWIFDAMLRHGEENIIEQEADPILDNVAESGLESTKSPDEPISAMEKELGQF